LIETEELGRLRQEWIMLGIGEKIRAALPYCWILVNVGVLLAFLRAYGADWLPLLVAGVAIYIATLVVCWERQGKYWQQ
jgi:hypothetical protein